MKYELPKRWTYRAYSTLMKEVVEKNRGNVDYPPLSVTQGNGVILQSDKYNKRIASEDTSGYKIAPRGAVIMNPNYLNYGAIGIQEVVEAGVVSPIYGVFEIDDSVDQVFMKYLLRSRQLIAEYNRYANGGCAVVHTGELHGMHVRLTVPIEEFLKITWMFPPVDEQRKIANILNSIDNAISQTEAIIEQTGRVKKGLMQQLLMKGIGHTEFKQTEVGEIPLGWNLHKLEELCDDIFVGIASSTTEHYCSNDGVPLIRSMNIKTNYLDMDDTIFITSDFSKLNKNKKLREDDVITVRTGANIGMTCVVPKEYENAQTFTTLVSRPDVRVLISSYLAHLMNSDLGKSQIATHMVGGAQPNLNVSALKKFLIPLPPIKEQERIVNILVSVESKKMQEQRTLSKLQNMKDGLLQVLLTGKIRVTVDDQEAVTT